LSYTPYSVYKAERLLRRRRRRVLFGVVGLVVVIGIVVGAAYLWVYLQWQKTQIDDPDVISALDSTPEQNLFPAPEGTMNILLMGIDDRGWEAIRSDTMILIHVDPANNYLSTLSLPRDLRVEVPGHGIAKLNSAYVSGGRELAIETAEKLTGVDLTHYMEIDFNAFKDLTDAVGGVYIDVDKHYLQQDPRSDKCDILPGYQKLDGEVGLDYVRFRKDDNTDFGRQARQQRFLAALREQAMGWDMGLKLPGIVTAVTDNIKTTISFDEIQSLAYWAVTRLSGGRIRQLAVIGTIQNFVENGHNVSYVVADEEDLRQKIADFATAPSGGGAAAVTTLASTDATTATTSAPLPASIDSSQFKTDPASIDDAATWRQIASEIPFKVMAPGYVPQNYILFDRNPQSGPGYDIDTGGGSEKGLKVIYQLQRNGEPRPQYVGIMETTWLDAPAAAPGSQLSYNGITYTVVGTYDQTERVWWVKDGVLYWVSNTILHYLDSGELIKMAASMMTIDSGTGQ